MPLVDECATNSSCIVWCTSRLMENVKLSVYFVMIVSFSPSKTHSVNGLGPLMQFLFIIGQLLLLYTLHIGIETERAWRNWRVELCGG